MIESMTHVAVMAGAGERKNLLDWLYRSRGFHVMPLEEEGDWESRFAGLADDSPTLDAELGRLQGVVSFCQEFQSKKPDFLDAMLPLMVVGNREEIDNAFHEVDIDLLQKKTAELRSRLEAGQERLSRLAINREGLERFSFLGDNLPALATLKAVVLRVVAVAGQSGKAFLLDNRIGDSVLAEEILADRVNTYYALVAAQEDKAELDALIDDHGLHPETIPAAEEGASRELAKLSLAEEEARKELAAARAEAGKFADVWIRKTSLALGNWESSRNLALLRLRMRESQHLFVARGYVKTELLDSLASALEGDIPGAAIFACPAPENENPPTSLKWNRWIRPASLLVNMYGLPAYRGIDPTIFVASIFFLFVGICLGDVVYGFGTILAMLWLKHRYREQSGLQDFFNVFIYCGGVAMVVGLLTGSFMGDLSAIIPGLEGFDHFRTSIALIDPIKDSQTALYIAIGLGIATQFYGMSLLVYRNLRRGDRQGALYDGGLWIGFFGFLLLAAFTGWTLFWVLFLLDVAGLILTQGRDQPNWFLRIIVGVISIYGIVGAYGASAFLGDTISYARLMALSLTTAALGSTFNMLAQLGGQIAVIGGVLAILIIIFGHLMNYFLGILGAFVHSARLVMLEFFGRFYEAGGYAYRPYGFDSTTVEEKAE
ncbi:MAG: hypothetical protein LBU79_02220 [Planctomycetota bacterium]|jgi:V/A-type H+-transporting ATPase subunit I|nr:hypothetical protein [Planctomycetota bacterium]